VTSPTSQPIVVGYRADAGGRGALRVGTELAVAFGADLSCSPSVPDADDTAELRAGR
jgi:hypothetical protein